MINREEAEAFINAAFLELGPACGDEWAEECADILRKSATDTDTKRVRPSEYYRPAQQSSVDEIKYAFYHVGDVGCGKIAFYTTRRLVAGLDTINAADVVLLDGSHPVDYDRLVCGSCGEYLSGADVEYR